MAEIKDFLLGIVDYLSLMRVNDVIDIAIIAFILFKLFSLSKSTNADKLLKGVAVFIFLLWISSTAKLNTVYYALSHIFEWGIVALIVLFQPEIRRVLEKIGSKDNKFFYMLRSQTNVSDIENAITNIVEACHFFSNTKTGALIVFERGTILDEQMKTGTLFDADVNTELIKNIFFINAPMHDGAMIIRDARISAAGCMLPLTKNKNVAKELGMRHRAGMGMSENSDAVVVIVSEETGSISVAIGGIIKRHLSDNTLLMLLKNELIPDPEVSSKKENSFHDFLSSLRKESEHEE